MNRNDLIAQCSMRLKEAAKCEEKADPYHSVKHMQHCLDLLIEELMDSATVVHTKNARPFNPECALSQIATAIKHRTISLSERWNIVYYHERITCVPNLIDVPEQIILGKFTERMVDEGFTVVYWNQLKTNVLELYRELHK